MPCACLSETFKLVPVLVVAIESIGSITRMLKHQAPALNGISAIGFGSFMEGCAKHTKDSVWNRGVNGFIIVDKGCIPLDLIGMSESVRIYQISIDIMRY